MLKGFKNLKIWQEGKELAVEIYKKTNLGEFKKDFGLRDHIRRTAVSVPSNIAEGDERGSNKESVRFFYIAKGSVAELRTQLEIAFLIGYLDEDYYKKIDNKYEELGKKIGELIKVRAKTPKP